MLRKFFNDAHGWNCILGHLELLNMDSALAAVIRVLAFLSLGIGIVFGIWLLWN